MANKLPVKFYFNTMPGMPQMANVYGDMVAVLDCVLVNGTTPVTVNSITFADGVCTATTAAAHGFIVNMVIEVSGATQDEFNGEWRLTGVTTNTFKFVPVVAPVRGDATGTLKARIPPLGYEIAFTATNRRVYRSKNVLSTRPFLRVDNDMLAGWNANYAVLPRVTAAKTMTDIDTFTDGRMPFDVSYPTKNDVLEGSATSGYYGWFLWPQSASSVGLPWATNPGTGIREWSIVGDDMAFYMHQGSMNHPVSQIGADCSAFGNFISYRKNDPYDYFLIAKDYRQTVNSQFYPGLGNTMTEGNNASSAGKILPKDAMGNGDFTYFSLHHVAYRGASTSSNRTNSIPFPNGADYSIRFSKRYICDAVRSDLRGEMPGQYFINQATSFDHRNIVNEVNIDGNVEKRKMLILRTSFSTNSTGERNAVAYDITGPWR